jgi:hypothetical protein
MSNLPPSFDGATHRLIDGWAPVKATHWVKDGDHPKVERYPNERREFKGILAVSPKEKFALRFGEWIVEDGQGRIWVESAQELPATKYGPLEG